MDETDNRVYYVYDSIVGRDVQVRFEPLTDADRGHLNGPEWLGARFGDVWLESAGRGVALKLTLRDGSAKPVLGVVRLGIAPSTNGHKGALRSSVLETAPAHRFGAVARRYRGVGRVLVARLIVESKAQCANGRILLRPARGSVTFYRSIGFLDSPMRPYLRLEPEDADALLTACTSSIME